MVKSETNDVPNSHSTAGREAEQHPELLAMLGHELRTPLAPIRNSAQLLRALCTDARQLKAVDIISRNVVHLTRMLDDLLDAARLRRGAFRLRKQVVDLGVLVREVLDNVQPAIDARQQSLVVTIPADAVQMFCDPVRLAQIISNLLNNANRYTPNAGCISLKASVVERELVVEVTDDGQGIDPSLLPRLFNVFAQAPQQMDRSQGGLGLGLAIARNLAEMHGGTLGAESQGVGRGSRFTLRLPIGDDLQHPMDESVSLSSEEDSIKTQAGDPACCVLIVEDNPDIAMSLEFALTEFGYTTMVASTGEQGLVAAEQFRPQVVLLDIGLPGINGFEVAQRLRESRVGAEVLLIGLSGYSLDALQDKTAHLVFGHYLIKPVDPLAIAKLIDASLSRGKTVPLT